MGVELKTQTIVRDKTLFGIMNTAERGLQGRIVSIY